MPKLLSVYKLEQLSDRDLDTLRRLLWDVLIRSKRTSMSRCNILASLENIDIVRYARWSRKLALQTGFRPGR